MNVKKTSIGERNRGQLALFTDPIVANDTIPDWETDRRGVPTALVLSAVFMSSNRAEPRKTFETPVKMFAVDGLTVQFKGEELRDDVDRLLWLQLVHLARGVSTSERGIEVQFTRQQMLAALKWQKGGNAGRMLEESLDRLFNAEVNIRKTKRGRGATLEWDVQFRFIAGRSRVLVSHDSGQQVAEYTIFLDRELIRLFDTGYMLFEATDQLLPPQIRRVLELMSAAERFGQSLCTIELQTLWGILGKSAMSAPVERMARHRLKVDMEKLLSWRRVSSFQLTKTQLTIPVGGFKSLSQSSEGAPMQ